MKKILGLALVLSIWVTLPVSAADNWRQETNIRQLDRVENKVDRLTDRVKNLKIKEYSKRVTQLQAHIESLTQLLISTNSRLDQLMQMQIEQTHKVQGTKKSWSCAMYLPNSKRVAIDFAHQRENAKNEVLNQCRQAGERFCRMSAISCDVTTPNRL